MLMTTAKKLSGLVFAAVSNPVVLITAAVYARRDRLSPLIAPQLHEATQRWSSVLVLAVLVWTLRNLLFVVAILRFRTSRGLVGLIVPPAVLLLYTRQLRCPSVRFVPGSATEQLLRQVHTLRELFLLFPVWSVGWWGGLLQTAFASVLRKKSAFFNYAADVKHAEDAVEYVQCRDGGRLRLEWFPPESDTPERPVVVIFPGNVGGSGEVGNTRPRCAPDYMSGLIRLLTRDLPADAQMRVCVYVRRGCGQNLLHSARVQSYIGVEDSSAAFAAVRLQFPAAPILAVGYSLGGTILTNCIPSLTASSSPDSVMCCQI